MKSQELVPGHSIVCSLNTEMGYLKPVRVGRLNYADKVVYGDDGSTHCLHELRFLNPHQVAEITRHLADMLHAKMMIARIWECGNPCGIPKPIRKVKIVKK